MKTPAERGRYGRWLVAARRARGWKTTDEALAALAAAGIKIGESVYRQYESGSKVPSRNHLPILVDYWGPVRDALEPTETTDPLVSALDRQSEAIEGLTAELAKDRADQREATDALLRLVVTAIPAPPGRPADNEPATPVDTAR